MNYAFSIAMLAMVLGAALKVGTMSGTDVSFSSGEFDYEEASIQEQDAWLQEQALPIKKRFRRIIRRGWRINKMEIAEIMTHAIDRKITFIIQIKTPMRLRGDVGKRERKVMERVCPGFMQSELYRNNVSIVQSIYYVDGRRANRFTISPRQCDSIVG